MYRKLFITLLLLIIVNSMIAQTTWINHITGGSDNLYGAGVYTNSKWTAVGTSGAIWQSINAGATWTQQNSTTQMPLHDVTCVSSAAAFAVGDSGIILKTTNSGSTWTRQTSGTYMPIQSVFFRTNQIGFACGWAGNVFSTTNGGLNWSMQMVSLTANFNDIFFTSSTTGYTVGWAGVIYKTTNGGGSWSPQSSNVTVNLNEVHFFDSLNGFCAGGNGTLLKTTDGGANWIPVTSFTTDVIESLYFVSPVLGFCGTDAGDIFVSTDGGNNWLLLPSNGVAVYDIELVNNQTCIASSDMGYVQESTYLDWVGSPNTDYVDFIEFVNDSVGFAISSVNNNFQKTTDGGATWNVCYVPPNGGFTDIDFVDDSVGYVAAALWLYKTTDQGNSWTPISQPYGTYYIDFITEDVGFGDYGALKRTTDGGMTWMPLGDYHGVDPVFFDIDSGYARSSQGLRFTDNGGNSWVSHPTPCGIHNMFVLNKNIIYIWNDGYAANDTSKLYRTFDAGNTFVQLMLPTQGDPDYVLEDAYFTDSLTGYIAIDYASPFYDLFIYKTIDGGLSWFLQGIEFGTSGWTTFEFANKNQGFCASAQGIMRNVNSDPPPVGLVNPPYNYNVNYRQPAPPYSWIMEPGDAAQLNMNDSRDAHFAGTETDYTGNLVFAGTFNDKCEIAGNVMDSPFNSTGIFLGRCHEDMYVDWVIPFYISNPGIEPVRVTSVSCDWFNQILIAGVYSGTLTAGSYTLTSVQPGNFIIKLDSTGTVLWARTLTPNVTVNDHYFHAELDSVGNVFFAGNYTGPLMIYQLNTLNQYGHCFVGKFSDQGNIIWCIQSSDNRDTRAISCSATPEGDVVVCGRYNGSCKFGTTTIASSDSNEVFVARFFGSYGGLDWIAHGSGPGNDLATDIDCDAAGNIYVVGTFDSICYFDSTSLLHSNGNSPATFITMYDANGDFQWTNKIIGVEQPSLSVPPAGNCYVTGSIAATTLFSDTSIAPLSAREIVALKLNMGGKILWVTRAGGTAALGTQENTPTGIVATTSGNCYITGKSWGYDFDTIGTYQNSTGTVTNGAFHGYFAKIGYGVVYNGIENDNNDLLIGISIYPVPADDRLKCDVYNHQSNNYTIALFDAQGRCVLSQQGNPSGSNLLETGFLPNGIYHLQVLTSDGAAGTTISIVH